MEGAERKVAETLEGAERKVAETLADARREGQEILRKAEERAAHVDLETSHRLEDARKRADALVADLTAQSRKKKEEAEQALVSASLFAGEIRQEAEKKAVAIAGKAYEAMKRAEEFQAIADALNNAIKGYGNRYATTSSTIVDTWAEEFGFSDPGERLRIARERTRLMAKNRTAATCEYAEAVRRELAINFVLEAFDGKVDAILSRVRHDNYGTLKQQIVDAYHKINFNGKSFREARITEEYLESQLDELRWAEAVQQLRDREKEEQRAIREQMREEEKARREYERAIKQTQRDEDLLKKALDKLHEEYAKAGQQEREKFDARMHDLEKRLREAEEKNRRAISMAQQTRCGHVYIISNIGSFGEDVFKVGLTRRLEPLDRVRELGDASVPFPFDVHSMIYSEDAPALESALHRRFVQLQVNKANRRKEFFRISLHEIRAAVEEMNLDVTWTMTAEARQYRETLALEQAMREDPTVRDRWVTEQTVNAPPPVFEDEDQVHLEEAYEMETSDA